MRKSFGKPIRGTLAGTAFALLPLLCLAAGAISGAVRAGGLGAGSLSAVENALIRGLTDEQNASALFWGNTLTNGGYMLVIWLTAFIPLGYIAAGLILFIRAMGYGFTLAAIIAVYNQIGFTHTANVCLQGIILLAAAYLVCLRGLHFGKQFRDKNTRLSKRRVLTYLVVLLIAETSVVLASML